MTLPRWTAYVALGVIGIVLVSGIPRTKKVTDDRAARKARGKGDTSASMPVGPPTMTSAGAATTVVKTDQPRVVVLGIDGLDPDILDDVMQRFPDRMTNFRRLADAGEGVTELGTSTPPQSPVAWSNFITGRRAGGHGVFDFIHRDPNTYEAIPGAVRTEGGGAVHLPGTDLKVPTGGSATSNRSGRAFWSLLADAGVAADLYRVPINYPVEASKGVSIPGMLTPALDSPYGLYTVYSTDPPVDTQRDSGSYRPVRVRDGAIRTQLSGPANAFVDGDPKVSVPLTFFIDQDEEAVIVDLGGERIVMQPGDWSRFMSVDFDMLPAGTMDVTGMVRFYLKSLAPTFEMYVSPVNFDPRDPASTISEPAGAASDLAEAIGPYFTKGMAEDVGALKEGVFTDAEFMRQTDLVFLERSRMLDHALDRYAGNDDGGLLFFYVSSVDLTMHMMWRHQDPQHPGFDVEVAGEDSSWWSGRDGTTWRDVVDDLYIRMDPLLGRVLDRVGDDSTVIVMSDHGFAPYRRKFSLNTWLLEEGYLVLKDGEERELALDDPAHAPAWLHSTVDWSKTRAYGVGFNGLYLNMKGREAQGIVDAGAEADLLLKDLALRLERIDDRGSSVVLVADIASEIWPGDLRVGDAPDIIVGYNRGYGNSDEASLGRIPASVLSDNTGGTFNGSHLMHPSVVGGVLLTNGRITGDAPRLEDVTASILSIYGVQAPESFSGKPVLESRQ